MSAEAPAPQPAAPPHYRYFTVAPATVRLTVDDLIALLPPEAWIGPEADKQRELALPAAEILETNFPRIRASRLRDLLPGNLRLPDGTPEWVALPTDRVALAYRPETRRELIVEAAEKPTDEPAEPARPQETPVEPAAEAPTPAWKRVPKPVPAPVALADLRVPAEAEARLQQIFLTEEELPVSHLIALAGALPGLQGCVLVRGAESVRSPGVPVGLDVPSLATGTADLLTNLGKPSGLHFQPAITLYAESGPVSLLHAGNFRLLVLHRERGFLPGVREKLATALEILARA
jgi:hypothetical protein